MSAYTANFDMATSSSDIDNGCDCLLEKVCSSENKGQRRSTIMEEALMKTVKEFLGPISFELFKRHYPDIYKQDPKVLKEVYYEFVDRLEKKLQGEARHFLSEKNVLKLLDGLDELIHQADAAEKNGTDSKAENPWRPSRNPHVDIQAHRIEVKMKAKEALTQLLQDLQNEQECLQAEVIEKQKKLIELEEQVDKKVTQFEQVAATCQQVPLSEIQQYLSKSHDLFDHEDAE